MRNRTGLLVVRVWIEGDSDDVGLPAHITQTVDLHSGAEVVSVAATSDDVYAAVRGLLEAYLDS